MKNHLYKLLFVLTLLLFFTGSTTSSQACTFTISPSGKSCSSAGGTGSVDVATDSACIWTASSNDSWITITSDNSGTGNGTLSYSVDANSDLSSRIGTITIEDQIFSIIQCGTTSCGTSVTSLVRKWGYVRLNHDSSEDDWESDAGTIIFNSDGTGTRSNQENDSDINEPPKYESMDFIYSTQSNPDGSVTLLITDQDGNADGGKFVLSDNGNMFIVDGTADQHQEMLIGIKMDESKTYSNEDLIGEAYGIGYGYDMDGTFWLGNYVGWSEIKTFDGDGNCPHIVSWNSEGVVRSGSYSDTYTLNPDGSISMTNGKFNGYIGKNESLAIFSNPDSLDDFEFFFGMKKGDRTYSTSDLAGTWAVVGFGDGHLGSMFGSAIGTMNCDSVGNCVGVFKEQVDGSVEYDLFKNVPVLSVSSDGSFGLSFSESEPSYAAAIGNDGNTIIINRSFDENELDDREIYIGVKCDNCWNLAGQIIPMYTHNPNEPGNGANIYLYNPFSQSIYTVYNETPNGSMPGNTNPDQTKFVYTEGTEGNPFTIMVYDISLDISTEIFTATTDRVAYFDENGKIFFTDSSDGIIKSMYPDGTNITNIASPESPYTFGDEFWISPDREKIIAVEKGSGDYQRLIYLNKDDGSRLSVSDWFSGLDNNLSWRGSNKFLFYYYQSGVPKYYLVDLFSGSLNIIDLSYSDLGGKENFCFYTKTGNLLSLSNQELFNGMTGALISSRPDVPVLSSTMFGSDNTGEIYFADLDKTNFRRFNEALQYTLTISITGGGTGTVTSLPVGIDCCSDCSEPVCSAQYGSGAEVTLTASADVGYVFTGWSGGVCSGTGDCVVTLGADTIVTATFVCTYTISPTDATYTQSGGTGTVDVTTDSICPWTASSNDSWITVTSGSSSTGSDTVSYSVDANTGAARTGTMTIAGQTFTVSQSEATYTVDITTTGNGTVRSVPSGPYAFDTRVVFYIKPAKGYHVSEVKIDGISIGAVKTVTFRQMTSDHTLVVTFKKGKRKR